MDSIISKHTVEEVNSNVRLQEYGVGIFEELPTKSSLKKAIKKKRVLVNGKVATTATYIHTNDIIELLLEQPVKRKVYNIDLNLHYEDEFLAIIEKPAGISVSGNKFSTIQNALAPHIKMSNQCDATYPHPVHRLDYPTSGLLIVGKTASCRRKLHKMFEEQNIHKTYHAVTVGKINNSEGRIDIPIEGQTAITDYKVIDSIKSERFEALNLLKLHPKTGRMHQLRRHLCAIQNPIMGDQKYFLPNLKHKGYGLYLHASRLQFIHPITQEDLKISSPLPKKFLRLFPLVS